MQAGKLQHPPVARAGAITGQSICESPHDGRGASKYSTAAEHSGRGVRASPGGQQELAGARTDAEAAGIACSAHQASVVSRPRQQGSLKAQADDQDSRSHSAHNDSSSNMAARSPTPVKCPSDPGARTQEGLKRSNSPQPVQGKHPCQMPHHASPARCTIGAIHAKKEAARQMV